jgi:uncharacterized protein YlaI
MQEKVKSLRKKLPAQEKCSKCGKTIFVESPDTGPKTIDNKPVCDECYYGVLGNEVEKNPFKRPPIRREEREISQCSICGGVHTGECSVS